MKKKSRKIRKKDLPNPTKAYTGRSTTKKSFRPHAQKYNDKEYDDNEHTQQSPSYALLAPRIMTRETLSLWDLATQLKET
jgi:hypothetical protein